MSFDIDLKSGILIPGVLHDYSRRDREKILNTCSLLDKFFAPEHSKSWEWLNTENPSLGNVKPLQMILQGGERYKKLIKFIKTAIRENER
jgi:hypothetical protein